MRPRFETLNPLTRPEATLSPTEGRVMEALLQIEVHGEGENSLFQSDLLIF